MIQPSLFGLEYSNRDFTHAEGWSKNNFNATFPTSLACYMYSKNLPPAYIVLDENGRLKHEQITVEQLFGANPVDDNLFYAFENDFTPYQQLIVGNLPRIDLVTITRDTSIALRGLEIKLTALPDNSTYHLPENQYGCELVIRPDTIVYLALSIAHLFKDDLQSLQSALQSSILKTINWQDSDEMLPHIPNMVSAMQKLMNEYHQYQTPLIMQPIWKTEGKKTKLHYDTFDIFVWSNFAFTRLFFSVVQQSLTRISRPARAIIWLMKMLIDFAEDGKINHMRVIDELSHATKNDKAFSVSGIASYPYMKSDILTKPRIKHDEIRHIILGGGQNLLSPERRLDAVILNTPDLFD
jgi:hypothetical protein